MRRGFYTILAAQFFSSLADNALFIVAVELLSVDGAAEWQRTALVPMFALFYVLLAPWVGSFADSRPKGRVMFISNAIKVLGCLLMLAGGHPLLAYAIVGLGAAAYSPAKYGILTELLPPSLLVKGNGWMEGLTIASIILGVVLGGLMIRPEFVYFLQDLGLKMPVDVEHRAVELAMLITTAIYGLAAAFNLRIPKTGAKLQDLPADKWSLLADFWRCNKLLWRDRLGQISLSTTTLFWGVSGNMRYIVLAWAALALGYSTSQSSALVGVVAIGTAVGATLASLRIRLDHATRVLPLGMLMGVLLIAMIFVRHLWVAVPFLIFLGALGGYIVVPMNALLQHRGYILTGAGRSIAVQNFNEQACILGLGLLYSASSWLGMSAYGAIALFGFIVIGFMFLIGYWLRQNLRHHPGEMAALLRLARNDQIHS